MAGIYIHIPFCKQACHYCDFHFSTSTKFRSDMVDAIIAELRLRSADFGEELLDSIYFGGGTPSLLLGDEVSAILNAVRSEFKLTPDAEITLEANPDDLDREKLLSLHNNGVNRLSIGVQSFNDELLKLMNRAHSESEALQCIDLAREIGFKEMSIDLIYGIPGSTIESWKNDVEKAIQHRPKHISSYCLTIEEKTAFSHFIKSGKMPAPDEELASAQYALLCEMLAKAGYQHYEVSNFALPGFEAKHNSSYWSGRPYLGLGPSAHSFYKGCRFWNVANNALYLKAIAAADPKMESEELSKEDKINERIMTGLRTKKGIDLQEMREILGHDLLNLHREKIEDWVSKSWLLQSENRLQPTEEGFLWSDHMASELFIVQD